MVTNTQKVIGSLASLIIDIIDVAKTGIGIGSLAKVIAISNDMKKLLSAAPEAFPEMKNLTGSDVTQLGSSSYDSIVKIIEHLKSVGMIK